MNNKAIEQEWKHFTEKTEEEIELEAEQAWKEYVRHNIIKFSLISLVCIFIFHDIIYFWFNFGIPKSPVQKVETPVSLDISKDLAWEKTPIEDNVADFEVYKTLENKEPVFIKKKAKFSVTANVAAKNYLFWGNYLPNGKRTFQSVALMDMGLTWGKLAKPVIRDLYLFYCTKDTIGRSFLTKLKWTTKILPLP